MSLCHRANPRGRPGDIAVLRRALRLCKEDRFEPAEAFRLGLFRRARCNHGPSPYVSRKCLTKAQKALNPAGWASVLKNKDLFYRYCAALGIPIPQLYAVVQSSSPGWCYAGCPIRTRDDWKAFFESDLPAEFAVKPAVGAYGQGFNFFHRTDGEYVDAAQTRLASGALYDTLVSAGNDRYVLQERLHNHSKLVRLSATKALQTVRMITLVDQVGSMHLLHAHLKVIAADEIVDTFIDGLTGNIEAPVDLESGCLKPANRIPGTGAGVMAVEAHPKTKTPFKGFALPFWSQACDLVQQTALQFLPIRTVGWDVALTPRGPVIVEGNVWWDPPNQHGSMEMVLRQLGGQDLPRPKG
jgi:Sugar-transfer associated ATP-grasp